MLAVVFVSQSAAQECDFPAVKGKIDQILDRDKKLGEKFRKEVGGGEDSIEAINTLVDKPTRNMIELCRFHVAEYLAKRGYPPAH